jgi:hypothetical protein
MLISGLRSVSILAICIVAVSQPGSGSGLRPIAPKREIISGRIVAKVPLQRLTSIGMNYESYVLEVESGGKENTRRLIKLSYRFDQREARIPTSFFDYSLSHRFRVTRGEDCDESWESISNRLLFDKLGNFHGRQPALIYAKGAPQLAIDPDTVLPCYSATPHDYRSTAKLSAKTERALTRIPDVMPEREPSSKPVSTIATSSR